MKDLKVAIITMYHKNYNYGGVLQAYALLKKCEELGYSVEQVDYYYSNKKRYILSNLGILSSTLFKTDKQIKNRRKKIDLFREKIKHSKLYFSNTTYRLNNYYDCFIVGSDQVWNPISSSSIYFLPFKEKDKYAFSYAASMGRSKLIEEDRITFTKMADNFNAISVREMASVDLLDGLSDKKIELTLDPTLLFNSTQWDSICSNRIVKEKYIFCYFLTDSENIRKCVKNYATQRNIKIVTMPYLGGEKRDCNIDFGDIKLFDVDPSEFISLIKFSESVFTDSFHAVSFSHIYCKQFFVVNNAYSPQSKTRIENITYLFDTQNHFLDTPEKIDTNYIDTIEPIDYTKNFDKFEQLKKKSISFLEENLKKAEEYARNNR